MCSTKSIIDVTKNVVPNVRKLVNMFCARPCFHSLAPVRRKALHCSGATYSTTRDMTLSSPTLVRISADALEMYSILPFKVRVKRKYPKCGIKCL